MPSIPPPVPRARMHLGSMLLTVVLVVGMIGGLMAFGAFKHPAAPARDKDGWIIPMEQSKEASSACQAGAFAAYNGCRDELNDQWYDAGAVDEPKVQKAKDYDRCHRVEENTFHACNQYGKDRP